jgi:hypothetical protein
MGKFMWPLICWMYLLSISHHHSGLEHIIYVSVVYCFGCQLQTSFCMKKNEMQKKAFWILCSNSALYNIQFSAHDGDHIDGARLRLAAATNGPVVHPRVIYEHR